MLDGYRVLDCSDRLGWLCGRILGELGADVLKVDPPGTDRSAAEWRAANVNKARLTLDLLDDANRDAFRRLVEAADVVVCCYRPGTPAAAAFARERLERWNPRAIVVAITPFGESGPRAGWQASDIELMAAGGALSLTGEPGATPYRVSVPQSPPWTGAQAAVGALVALNHRTATGHAQRVTVSAQAGIITALAHAPTFWDINRINPERAGTRMTGRSVHGAVYRVFWPCRDGYLNFILYGGVAGRRTNEALVAWMREAGHDPGALGDIDWQTFDSTQLTQAEVDALEGPILGFFAGITKREFLHQAHRRSMLGYPVSNVADIATDDQLQARDYWTDLVDGTHGTTRHCGGFAIVDGERLPVRPPARSAWREVADDAELPGAAGDGDRAQAGRGAA